MPDEFELIDAEAGFICVRRYATKAEFGFLISNRAVASGAVINPDTPANRDDRRNARRFAQGEAMRLGYIANPIEDARLGDAADSPV